MTKASFMELLKHNPVIASVKSPEGVVEVKKHLCDIVFVLFGDILSIAGIVAELKAHNKTVFVDTDLIEGLSSKSIAVDFIAKKTEADGILSAKAPMITAAKAQGLLTVHRLFVIDSFSFHGVVKQVKASRPDCVQILPGCAPKIIEWSAEYITVPIIAGGLICERSMIVDALKAGAVSTTTSGAELWSLKDF